MIHFIYLQSNQSLAFDKLIKEYNVFLQLHDILYITRYSNQKIKLGKSEKNKTYSDK